MPPSRSDEAQDRGRHHREPVHGEGQHADAGEPREPEPGLGDLEGQGGQPEHEQEVDHRRASRSRGRPAGSARGCRIAGRPFLRSASASLVAMRVSSVTGPLGVCTVCPSTSSRKPVTDVAAAEAMPSSIASAAGKGSSVRSSCVSLPRSSIHPSIVASRSAGTSSGCSRSTGSSGSGLRTRCDPRERRGVHQQHARARRGRGGGADPRQHGHVEIGDSLCEGDAVLAERARGVELEHDDRSVALGLREPILEVAEQRPIDRTLDPEHHDRRRARPRRPAARQKATTSTASTAEHRATRRMFSIVPAGSEGYPGRQPHA